MKACDICHYGIAEFVIEANENLEAKPGEFLRDIHYCSYCKEKMDKKLKQLGIKYD